MRLPNEVDIKCLRDAPYGEGIKTINLNGMVLEDVKDVNLHFTSEGLHEVTIVLHAHVSVEEVDE